MTTKILRTKGLAVAAVALGIAFTIQIPSTTYAAEKKPSVAIEPTSLPPEIPDDAKVGNGTKGKILSPRDDMNKVKAGSKKRRKVIAIKRRNKGKTNPKMIKTDKGWAGGTYSKGWAGGTAKGLKGKRAAAKAKTNPKMMRTDTGSAKTPLQRTKR